MTLKKYERYIEKVDYSRVCLGIGTTDNYGLLEHNL